MEKILRTDINIMNVLVNNNAKGAASGMTIYEIMNFIPKSRSTFCRRLKELEKYKFIARGCIDNHAVTYFILDKGIRYINYGCNTTLD